MPSPRRPRTSPPLATLANGVRMDFPNAVEFHLMYAGVAEPQSVDLEYSIQPVHSCDGGTIHLRAVPGKDHDYLAVGTFRGTAYRTRSRRAVAMEGDRRRRQHSRELSAGVCLDGRPL